MHEKRKDLPQQKDKKVFNQTAKKTKALNHLRPGVMRGGIRL